MSYRFTDLGRALNKIAQKLNSDQELRRLLKYMQSDPLSTGYDDIDMSISLINKNILIVPKLSTKEVVESFILIAIPTFEVDSNLDFTSATITVDVICPLDKWLIDDICPRPFKIMDRISDLLEGSRVTGIGTLNFVTGSQSVIYEGVSDHQMVFEVTANG